MVLEGSQAGILVRATWRKPLGRPRTGCRDYVSRVGWEYLTTPQEELGDVGKDKGAWADLVSLLQ